MDQINPASVRDYLADWQVRVCSALEDVDGPSRFRSDRWVHPSGGGGDTRVLEGAKVFEKAGVAFSHVKGDALPVAATAQHPELAHAPFEAMGVSVVIHPLNPYVPTSHANVRFLHARTTDAEAKWWFGGGFDLTPCYGFEEDAVHWHRTAEEACRSFAPDLHHRLKETCDRYFFLKHRGEPRGIGGLFFDDFVEGGFERAFAFLRSVGDHFLPAYLPIVDRRRDMPWGERERAFQLYRRGRYVEFNLVWDRGTHFGLQSGGRAESILMSMPPQANWRYDWRPEPGSPEERLYTEFLKPRDWLNTE